MSEKNNSVSVLPFGACMIHFLLFRFLNHGWAREVESKENLCILMENRQETSVYVETINAAQQRLEAEVLKDSGPEAPKVFFGTPPGQTQEKVFGPYSSGSGSIRVEWKENHCIVSFHLGRKGFDSPAPRIGEAKIFYNNPQKVIWHWKNEHLFRGSIGDEPMEYILEMGENFLALFGQKLPRTPDRSPVPRLSQVARSTRGRAQMMRF